MSKKCGAIKISSVTYLGMISAENKRGQPLLGVLISNFDISFMFYKY